MHIRSETAVVALGLLSGACAGEMVELGQVNRPWGVAPSRCRESTLLAGSVLVEGQAQLDELAGCEEIAGHLLVKAFEAPRLAPLASLRRVAGALIFGLSDDVVLAVASADVGEITIGEPAETEIIASGWLSSFEGLERLESVGSLSLNGISAPHLEPLSSLRRLTDGALSLTYCTNLRDLHGLEGLENVVELSLACDSLESLAGLFFPPRMRTLALSSARLSDVANVDVQYIDNQLLISNTQLENLDALASLSAAADVYVGYNAALTNADALNGLAYASSLEFNSNPRLEQLPEFTSLGQLDRLSVKSNSALRTLGSFPSLTPGRTTLAEEELVEPSQGRFDARLDVFQVQDNPLLETLEVPAGWRAASYVVVDANASLRSIRLSTLSSIDAMIIRRNALLESVELGALETVDELSVYENPLLPLGEFERLRTFQSQLFTGPIE